MITSIDYIKQGASWPPVNDKARIDRYNANLALFNGEHAQVYGEQLKRIERVIGDYEEVISYPTVFNYQRLISLKTSDLLWGEIPEVTVGDENKDNTLQSVLQKTSFFNIGYSGTIDISRYGNAVIGVERSDDREGNIYLISPQAWVPVVSATNITRITHNIIWWDDSAEQESGEPTKVFMQIHDKGKYEYREYAYNGGVLGVELERHVVNTGVSDSLIYVLQGLTTSDTVYGHDDYTQIESVVSEIMVRMGQICKILDKHAEPSMYGSDTHLVPQEDGTYVLNPGNFYPIDETGTPPGYITWDGNIQANMDVIKQLMEQIYALSELGGTLLGSADHAVGAESARALKLRMVNPLAKVQRIAANITDTLKRVIATALQLDKSGFKVKPEEISINWLDGLPNDEREDQEIIQLKNGGLPTMSHTESIRYANNMGADEAEKERLKIIEEQDAYDGGSETPDPFEEVEPEIDEEAEVIE